MAMDSIFDRAVAAARQLGASDIHLKPDLRPILRIDGELRTLKIPAPRSTFRRSRATSSTTWRCRCSTIGGATSSSASAT